MSAAKGNVVRFDLWIDPAFDAGFAATPGVASRMLPMPADAAGAIAALKDAHVYHVSAAKDEVPPHAFVSAGLIAACPQLLCVSSYGAGYDTVDAAACTAAGIAVVNQSGGNAVSVAEHAMGLILCLTHRLAESDRLLRTSRGFSREDLMGREIAGTTLGVIGIGHIGRRVAALARAFGLQVLAYDPLLEPAEIERRGARAVSFEELLASSDIVSVHCPRNQATARMFDAKAFARMKSGATFISTARGGIHDETALHDALRGGHLAGAGLDVWDQEPPPLEHPLLTLPNVVATFHTAGVTAEARRNNATIAAQQIVDLLAGGKPPRLVNPEVWPRYAERFGAIMGMPVRAG